MCSRLVAGQVFVDKNTVFHFNFHIIITFEKIQPLGLLMFSNFIVSVYMEIYFQNASIEVSTNVIINYELFGQVNNF